MRQFREIVSHNQDAFLLFCMINGGITAMNYAIFFCMYSYGHVHYLLASVAGYSSAIILSFFLHKKYTFRSRSTAYAKEGGRFLFVFIGFLLAGLALFEILVRARVSPLLANLISLLTATILTYFGSKNIAFQKKQE